ncbi:MAG: hypothetical protein MZV49_26185 [Rhodopseudomonas palustris]|nr:hypothetical protein [Rhodopseudomonas palustris]
MIEGMEPIGFEHHPRLRPHRGLRPGLGVRRAARLGRAAARRARPAQRAARACATRCRKRITVLDPETMSRGAARRRDHGRDHVPRQHRDEGLPEEPEGHARKPSPAAGSTPAISACSHPRRLCRASRTAPRTSSSRAARTCPRSRSRTCCTGTRRCCSPRWWPSPIRKWGEVPCAFVELKEGASATEAEIIAYCREQLPGFKTPKVIEFASIAENLDRQDPEIHAARSGEISKSDFRIARQRQLFAASRARRRSPGQDPMHQVRRPAAVPARGAELSLSPTACCEATFASFCH